MTIVKRMNLVFFFSLLRPIIKVDCVTVTIASYVYSMYYGDTA